jgi:ParB/RepB/Spo0J family partition protein
MVEHPFDIPLADLDEHPNNPRLVPREDVIEAICASINGHGFDRAYALIVRPTGDRFQVVSGHHRLAAAMRASLATVPCWVREMDDDTAYMELVRSNAQSELTALERGLHAWGATEKGSKIGKSIVAYADAIGRGRDNVKREIWAAEVASVGPHGPTADLAPYYRHLAEIHVAPRWLWPALVERLLRPDTLSVAAVKELVGPLKAVCRKPGEQLKGEIFDIERIARALVAGRADPDEVAQLNTLADEAVEAIYEAAGGEVDVQQHLFVWRDNLRSNPARSAKDLRHRTELVLRAIRDERLVLKRAREDQEAEERRAEDEARIEAERLFANVSLDEWKTLDDVTRRMLLDVDAITSRVRFNEQDNDATFLFAPIPARMGDRPARALPPDGAR